MRQIREKTEIAMKLSAAMKDLLGYLELN